MIGVRIFFSLLIVGPIALGIYHWLQYQSSPAPKQGFSYKLLLNSAVLYALAYNLIFFLQELFLVLGKKALGLKAYLYHNNHGWDGSHEMESLMQGSGALAIFVIGLLCLVAFYGLRKTSANGAWKLFLLWMAFQGLIQSVPQVMVAFFDANTDVGQALVGYWAIPAFWLALLSMLSILGTILISVGASQLLLSFAPNDVNLENPRSKLRFMLIIAVIAGLLGCVLIIPFRIPPMSQMVGPFVLFLFSIPWVWAVAPRLKFHFSIPHQLSARIYWGPIILLVLLLLGFRLVLAPGVAF